MGSTRRIAGIHSHEQRPTDLHDELGTRLLCLLIRKKSLPFFAVPMTRDPWSRKAELFDAAIAAESIQSGKEGSSTCFRGSLRDPQPTQNTQLITISSFTEPSKLEKVPTRGASVKLSRRRGGGIASGKCVPSLPCL